MQIPAPLLERLYTSGTLQNVGAGVQFSLKNRLTDAHVVGLHGITIGGRTHPMADVTLHFDSRPGAIDPLVRAASSAASLLGDEPIAFPLGSVIDVVVARDPLPLGSVEITVDVETVPFGRLTFSVEDEIAEPNQLVRIPRHRHDDYTEEAAASRLRFLEEYTGVSTPHVAGLPIPPPLTRGNIENFIGTAQVPIGLAGPLTVHGEHANGSFVVPLATTEGTLVASYSRGMKIVNLSGGVTCTVTGDAMQRAPVFTFRSARDARDFVRWIDTNFEKIREIAESTGSRHRLVEIEPYIASRMAYLRFNYTTGDAAGQNTVGKATFAASSWIIDHYAGIEHHYLESNLATDKKASHINTLRTRGKRVIAEAVIERSALIDHMRVGPESLARHHGIANIGAQLAGANNNGLHSANGITALFIATGQDVANVAESSSGLIYADVTPGGDLYLSITLPSLIVATYGGGTHLPTQAECLSILGCLGENKVNKLAEIVAATVLAGELSLAAAISASDWVSSHERFGRNR